MQLSEPVAETLYGDDDRPIGRVHVDVEVEAHTFEDDADALRAVQRIARAAKAEAQAVQDELDEDGEVHEA